MPPNFESNAIKMKTLNQNCARTLNSNNNDANDQTEVKQNKKNGAKSEVEEGRETMDESEIVRMEAEKE
jgi:hypothetical protein